MDKFNKFNKYRLYINEFNKIKNKIITNWICETNRSKTTNIQKLIRSHSFITVNRRRIANKYNVKKVFDLLKTKLSVYIIKNNKWLKKALGISLNDN